MNKKVAVTAWIGLVVLLVPSCNIKFLDKRIEQTDVPDTIIGNFLYLSLNSLGKKEWELKASEAKMFNAKNEIYLYNLSLIFYDENNHVQSYLTGDQGFVNKATLNVFVEGHVRILSQNEAVMSANKVFWDNGRKLFYTEPEELVTITRGNTIVTGYEMEADSALKKVTFQKTAATLQQ